MLVGRCWRGRPTAVVIVAAAAMCVATSASRVGVLQRVEGFGEELELARLEQRGGGIEQVEARERRGLRRGVSEEAGEWRRDAAELAWLGLGTRSRVTVLGLSFGL